MDVRERGRSSYAHTSLPRWVRAAHPVAAVPHCGSPAGVAERALVPIFVLRAVRPSSLAGESSRMACPGGGSAGLGRNKRRSYAVPNAAPAQHITGLPALAAQRPAMRSRTLSLSTLYPLPLLLRCAAFLIPYPYALLLLSIFRTHACTPIKRHRPPPVRFLSPGSHTCD